MSKLFPSPGDLRENPELASLRMLKTNLEVAEEVLMVAYPDGNSYSERSHTEQEAYANGLLYQIDTLEVMLNEYAESIRRLQSWRNREVPEPPSSHEQPSDDDIAF